jgi:hypothetical protein
VNTTLLVVLLIIPNHLAPSIDDVSNVIMGNLSFLKLVKALGSIEPLGKNHVLVVLNDFHEILVAKHVMNFAHIPVPLVYIFPLQKMTCTSTIWTMGSSQRYSYFIHWFAKNKFSYLEA